jgi:hypothetical protein
MATADTIPTYEKDPNEKLDYDVDFYPAQGTKYLGAAETIIAAAWAIDDVGDNQLAISVSPAPSVNIEGRVAKVWLEAGTVGQRYRVRVRVTTSDGRIADRSFYIVGVQK